MENVPAVFAGNGFSPLLSRKSDKGRAVRHVEKNFTADNVNNGTGRIKHISKTIISLISSRQSMKKNRKKIDGAACGSTGATEPFTHHLFTPSNPCGTNFANGYHRYPGGQNKCCHYRVSGFSGHPPWLFRNCRNPMIYRRIFPRLIDR